MRAPITSVKHYVQLGINSQMAGTIGINQFITARKLTDVAAAADVVEGSVIKAIYVEIWLLAGSQQPGSITAVLEKVPASAATMTFTQAATLQDYPNKKNIFYVTQGLTPDANGNPIPFIRGWYKIPKGKQRFGLLDKFILNLSANVEDCTFCGFATYKEYN